MPETDRVAAAFDAYREEQRGRVRPAGLGIVRAVYRRRRRARSTAVSLLASIVVAVPVAGYAYQLGLRDGGRRSTPAPNASPGLLADRTGGPDSGPLSPSAEVRTPAPSTSASTSAQVRTPSASASAGASAGAPCRAGQLSAQPGVTSADASQPSAVVVIVNRSATACQLTGYPGLTVTGSPQQAPGTVVPVPLDVTHGATHQQQDPGPSRVELAPNGVAWFAIGTGTAYEGGANITFLADWAVTVPGDNTAIHVTVLLASSAPFGKPTPVAVTAFAPGSGRP